MCIRDRLNLFQKGTQAIEWIVSEGIYPVVHRHMSLFTKIELSSRVYAVIKFALGISYITRTKHKNLLNEDTIYF